MQSSSTFSYTLKQHRNASLRCVLLAILSSKNTLLCIVTSLPIKPNTILAAYLLTLNPVYAVKRHAQADNVAFRSRSSTKILGTLNRGHRHFCTKNARDFSFPENQSPKQKPTPIYRAFL